ncbi:unnamed protein product [Alopecurus aequalis]
MLTMFLILNHHRKQLEIVDRDREIALARTAVLGFEEYKEIVAFEILVRLPPKAILRCRAVCRDWRRIASARNFLVAHHRRQPSLRLAEAYKQGDHFCHKILAIDHRAAQLQPVLQLSGDYVKASSDGSGILVKASCDGLLVLCIDQISICNPATRQFVGLNLHGFNVRALYLHRPTGDYRLLLCSIPDAQTAINQDLCYVLTLGCDQLPRCIGRPASRMWFTPVLVRGNLHWTWRYEQHQNRNEMVMTVFDTTLESFRQMRAPMVDNAFLFEMDDMLGMYSYSEHMTIVNIWVMEDYGRDVWSHMHKVKLPEAEIRGHLDGLESWGVIVTYEAGDLLVLVDVGTRVLHVDTEGKSLSSSDYHGHFLIPELVKLKQSLVPHVFFSRLQGAVNVWPFI